MSHVPVLLAEVMAALAPLAGAVVVDGTFGGGGYARAALAGGARVWALDRDRSAVARAWDDPKLDVIEARFGDMRDVLGARGVERVDAVTLDIGVSSFHLDEAGRGFAFGLDGPLDMRMGGGGASAADFVNGAEEAEIARVLRAYGELAGAGRVARALVRARPITRTGELAAVARRALGYRGQGKDPAPQVFQAVRIHINDELGELAGGLAAAEALLSPGGRLAVVTFHSLEDRMVKGFLRERSGQRAVSRHQPVAVGAEPSFEAVPKAVRPGAAELAANPRARSATLRAARRTAAPVWRAA